MLKIGEFSRLARVTVKALRLYGKLGLLKPAWVDRYTGYRYYALHQLPRLNRILALKDLGFSLEQIQELLQSDLAASELRGMLRLKHAELEQQVRAQQARLVRIEARLRQIEHEWMDPVYAVALKRVESQQVIGIRDTVPSNAGISGLFGELCAVIRASGLSTEGMGPHTVISYDAEYRERQMEVEAAIPLGRASVSVPSLARDSGRATVHNLPGAPAMACTVHQGAYETLNEAYSALTVWMQANACRSIGPGREVYLQGERAGVPPEQYVTEIQIPVTHASDRPTTKGKELTMEPKIVTKPAFTLIGMRYFGKNEQGEIPALWDHFGPRMVEIKPRDGYCCYGVCWQPDESGEFEYVAGVSATAEASIPDGMVSRSVPAAQYAVFPTKLKDIGETYRHISEDWLASSGYEWGGTLDFELYDDTFDPTLGGEAVLYIYFPIK